jgi:hypothetical protein
MRGAFIKVEVTLMRALVVYESMYGNTHAIADRIAEGFGPEDDVRVVPVRDATPDLVGWADLLVVGGPTHAHSLSRAISRKSAREAAAKPGSHLTMDAAADGPGLRDWLGGIGALHGKDAVAFDTRFDGPTLFTGRASKAIDRALQHRGATLFDDGESFLITRDNQLVSGERERAAQWGETLSKRTVGVAGRVAV